MTVIEYGMQQELPSCVGLATHSNAFCRPQNALWKQKLQKQTRNHRGSQAWHVPEVASGGSQLCFVVQWWTLGRYPLHPHNPKFPLLCSG